MYRRLCICLVFGCLLAFNVTATDLTSVDVNLNTASGDQLCVHVQIDANVDWILDVVFSGVTRPIRVIYDEDGSGTFLCPDSLFIIGQMSSYPSNVKPLIELAAQHGVRLSFLHVLDSPCTDDVSWYSDPHLYHVFRNNHCNIPYNEKVTWLPLGASAGFGAPTRASSGVVPAAHRHFFCGFIGDLDSAMGRKEQRTELAEFVQAHPELGCYLHSTAGFMQGLPRRKYRALVADTAITLCPRGFRFAFAYL